MLHRVGDPDFDGWATAPVTPGM